MCVYERERKRVRKGQKTGREKGRKGERKEIQIRINLESQILKLREGAVSHSSLYLPYQLAQCLNSLSDNSENVLNKSLKRKS